MSSNLSAIFELAVNTYVSGMIKLPLCASKYLNMARPAWAYSSSGKSNAFATCSKLGNLPAAICLPNFFSIMSILGYMFAVL